MRITKQFANILLCLIIVFYTNITYAQKAPDFTLFDQAGNTITLKAYRGKGVILHFWGTWCPFCKELQPGLERLYKKYHKSGLEVLAISIGESAGANPQQVLKALGVTFKTAVQGDKVARMYDVPGTPSTFFINREGDIIWKTNSSNAVKPEIEAYVRLILNLDQ
ncbi:MAG: TlpA disulfide reductase family protein [Oceanospirillaceae bacterium]